MDLLEWPLDLEREVCVVQIQGDELGPNPITRKAADRWAKNNLRGTYLHQETGWVISVGSSGIEEGLHRLTGAKHPEAIAGIPGLIASAIVVASRPDLLHRPEIRFFHTLLAPLSQCAEMTWTVRPTTA
jgi:hypothetical protein